MIFFFVEEGHHVKTLLSFHLRQLCKQQRESLIFIF